MRPTAVVLTPRMPWPLDDGGRIAMWQTLEATSEAYQTVVVSLVPPDAPDAPVPESLRARGVELVTIPHRPPPMPLAVLRGLGRWPYTLARYRSARLDAELGRIVARRRPAVVIANNLHTATALAAVRGAATVLRQQNVEHVWLGRYADTLRSPLARAYARDQARRMRRAEAVLCAGVDLVMAIHEGEAATLRALAPAAHVEMVPVGVDFSRFARPARAQPPELLLVGAFAWPPNRAGAERFLERGWPRVRARVPDARLRIVGKDLPRALAERARAAGAEPVGYVDAIAPEFARASALVVPLWAGAGARVKIVEALAARLPVVSTPLGAEGLELEPGREFASGETPEALGDRAAELLADPARVEALAEAGHARACAQFSLPAVRARTLAALEHAIRLHAAAAR